MLINGYGFEQLFQLKFIGIALASALFITSYLSKITTKWVFLIFILGFSLICIYQNTYTYLYLFFVALLPRIVFELKGGNNKLVDILSGMLLGAFFIYYFLFANQVIQALTGGL